MSEFSAGIFTLSKYKDELYPFLTEEDLLIRYNEMWLGKLSPMDMSAGIQSQTIGLSKEIPLLHIINAEDHGFFIQILYDGEVKFRFDVPYDIGSDIFMEIGNELYGDEKWFLDEDKVKTASDAMKNQPEIQNTIDGLFANISEESISAFELFGFGKETLQSIQNILTTANFKQNSQEMVYDLLDYLGLGEFSFVAHSYISDGYDDRFRILNA